MFLDLNKQVVTLFILACQEHSTPIRFHASRVPYPCEPSTVSMRVEERQQENDICSTMLHWLAEAADPNDLKIQENQVIRGRLLMKRGANVNAVPACGPI
jgi:hypothetical protein